MEMEVKFLIYYLAICEDCHPVIPVPFWDAEERDTWVTNHRAIGHQTRKRDEIVLEEPK